MPEERSDGASRLLLETPGDLPTRQHVSELLSDAEERLTAARRAAAESAHQAAVAAFERDRMRNRRAVRVATELTDRRRGVTTLPRRLKGSLAPKEAPEPPPSLPAAVPPVSLARDIRRELARSLLRSPPFPHLRILHLGEVSRFRTLAPHVAVDPAGWREQLKVGADVLLLEPPSDDPAWDPLGGEVPALLTAARELGIPTVRLSLPSAAGGGGDPVLELVEGVPGASGMGEPLAPSIDTGLFNPRGWQHHPPDPVVAVLGNRPDADGRALLSSFDPPVVVVHPASLAPVDDELGIARPVGSASQLQRALIRAGVLLDHPSWRADSTETLRLWTAALACGTPVVVVADESDAAGSDGLRHGDGTLPLPPGILVARADEAVETVHQLLVDPDLRERHGIVGRRWALQEGSRETALRRMLDHLGVVVPPPARTTVLLATNRPGYLEHGLDSVARQRQPRVDVSLVLHGPAFDGVDAPSRDGLISTVVRAPGSWPLGDCLNAGLDQAAGELVAKMDDDDHYGPDHLSDLVTAWGYSGADVVGKRVEYVHLARRGITIRRATSRPERDRPHVGGPTLLAARDTLRRYRFLRVPNRVDSTLYERILADDGRIYGIHSRDVVLERHGDGHAWSIDDDRFIAGAIDQREGFAPDLATSDPEVGT